MFQWNENTVRLEIAVNRTEPSEKSVAAHDKALTELFTSKKDDSGVTALEWARDYADSALFDELVALLVRKTPQSQWSAAVLDALDQKMSNPAYEGRAFELRDAAHGAVALHWFVLQDKPYAVLRCLLRGADLHAQVPGEAHFSPFELATQLNKTQSLDVMQAHARRAHLSRPADETLGQVAASPVFVPAPSSKPRKVLPAQLVQSHSVSPRGGLLPPIDPGAAASGQRLSRSLEMQRRWPSGSQSLRNQVGVSGSRSDGNYQISRDPTPLPRLDSSGRAVNMGGTPRPPGGRRPAGGSPRVFR